MKYPEQTYTIIETASGFLFFTHTPKGKKCQEVFLQKLADHYFDPHFNLGPVCLYEGVGRLRSSKAVNPGNRPLTKYPYISKIDTSKMDVRYRNGMNPTIEEFQSFCHNTCCSISARNGNITDSLKVLDDYDRQLWKLNGEHVLSTDNHEEIQVIRETREQIQNLLDSAYDVRGHRTAARILDDPSSLITVEGVHLFGAHRGVLRDGHCLQLSHESGSNPSHTYAWVDWKSNRIIFGCQPPPGRKIFRIKPNIERKLYDSLKSLRKKRGVHPKI